MIEIQQLQFANRFNNCRDRVFFGPFPHTEVSTYDNAILHIALSHRSSFASTHRVDLQKKMPIDMIATALAMSMKTIGITSPYVDVQVDVAGDLMSCHTEIQEIFDFVSQHEKVQCNMLHCDGSEDVRPIAFGRDMYVSFEIAGIPQVQDRLWPMVDGSPSSPVVERNIGAWIDATGHRRAIARAKITSIFPDVTEIYQYLYNMGFRMIRLDPLRTGPADLILDEQSVIQVMAGYERFADLLLSMDDALLQGYLSAILGTDIFGKFLGRLLTCSGSISSCPAGKASLFVDVTGNFYACRRFSGQDDLQLGTIQDGLSPTRRWPYLEELIVDRRATCTTCWCRYLCGGGCCFSAIRKSGNLKTPDQALCQLTQHLASLTMWFISELRLHRPHILHSLLKP